MERANISYSYKNIPTPDRHQYKLVLRRIEFFIKNMRWKAFFFSIQLTVRKRREGRNMGLKLRNPPPHIKEMDKFEAEMIGMVKEIKFRKMSNNIQQKMFEDMRRFKESENIFIKSDKSGNLYEIEKGKYKQMMFKEVVKNYKKAPPYLEKELNNEAKMLAHRLGIVDRVDKYNTKNCFITIKDHKSDFKTNPECRLINPAKTQIGRISKIIVQEICDSLRLALNINQWRSTKDFIKWFEEYEKNDRCSFIKYDIKDFYPSITERTLDRALDLAKEYMVIRLDKVVIIKHCRKTLLYYEDSAWIKKGDGGNFDVSIGAYDGAEISMGHMMAQKFVSSSGVYYYIVLIRLWTQVAMDFIMMTD